MKYDYHAIEAHWQDQWRQRGTFKVANPGDPGFDANKPKFYVLDMFPYPSGVGLHVGHPLGYIATDIVARYKRMTGFHVLHPMGYDAFGLPAEQFAVEHNVHPRITTEQNIANMTQQLKRLGLSYDWDRCLATTDPGYYRWTQWIFLQLYHSYFDPALKRAMPVSFLRDQLEKELYYVGVGGQIVENATEGLEALAGEPIGVTKWHELSQADREAFIDGYRLAYLAEVPVNWCPALGTVLANEEVTSENRSERGNHPVIRRPLKQWMLRITDYCERLLEDLDLVDWPEPVKLMQRNWIGRSEGAQVDFALKPDASTTVGEDETITVFTTRPDTLFGATYMVLAPEHPLVDALTTPDQRGAVRDYQRQAAQRSEQDRKLDEKTKTGVFTGSFAINPVNGEPIPVWIADYVMMGYGTGAIMAVPAHDERDFEFAKQFGLPIIAVVMPDAQWLEQHEVTAEDYQADPAALPEAFVGTGVNINSSNGDLSLDQQTTEDAKRTMIDWLVDQQLGQSQVQYKLRDWLFSRQRYWGEPFPILHGPNGQVRAVDEADLPVTLPPMDDFKPHAGEDAYAAVQTPLSRAPKDWREVQIDGEIWTRELNTMPQWAGSCWYYLRYLDPHNDQRFVDPETEAYWMGSRDDDSPGGVDLYVGGVEHAVLHLLYARFWHKVLYDLGHVSTPEPFGRLYNQGYIQAHAYTDARGVYVPADQVKESDGQWSFEGQPVNREFGKMGKSLKNAVAPDDMCEQFGCDTLRLYEMYLGPLDQSKVWRTQDIIGVHRFLHRVWRNFVTDEGDLKITDAPADHDTARLLHRTIRKVTQDMDRLLFNTAIAALIELNNALVSLDKLPRNVAEPLVLMLSPMAPHLCEQLWSMLGHETSLAYEPWPAYDETLLVERTVELPVQINGKLRGKITVASDAADNAIEQAAMDDAKVAAALEGKTVRKVIIVPGKMVNIVAN